MKRPTIHAIQMDVLSEEGFFPKSCWIAHVKEQMGLPVRRAWNRGSEDRDDPCPPHRVAAIKASIERLSQP
jgi:hypothetical protein